MAQVATPSAQLGGPGQIVARGATAVQKQGVLTIEKLFAMLALLAVVHNVAVAFLRVHTGHDIRYAHERRAQAHGVAGTFGMLVKGAVLLAIGVFVVGAIFAAIPDSNAMGDAQAEVEAMTSQAFEIAPIVLIVIVAVLILSFVRDL